MLNESPVSVLQSILELPLVVLPRAPLIRAEPSQLAEHEVAIVLILVLGHELALPVRPSLIEVAKVLHPIHLDQLPVAIELILLEYAVISVEIFDDELAIALHISFFETAFILET